MKEPLLGVVLDWDGVVCNSMSEAYAGVIHVCRNTGGREITYREFMLTVQAPYIDYYRWLGVSVSEETIRKLYHEGARHENGELFPDALEALGHLVDEHRAVIGIVTAQRDELVWSICRRFGIEGRFSRIVGRCEHKTSAILEFCREVGIPPDNTSMLGDRPSDMRNAREAGVHAIGVTRGDPTEEILYSAGAHICIQHLTELPAVLCCKE